MKKNIFITLLFVFVFVSLIRYKDSPDKLITINKTHYTVIYDEVKQQPIKITYKVLCNKTLFKRSDLAFYKEPGISTSDDADYRDNVYDKGHLAPAASFACDQMALKETFSYLNCALQHRSLNRGAWKSLEMHERDLLMLGDVYVEVDIIFQKLQILPTEAHIPTHFKKTIKSKAATEVYLFPNEEIKLPYTAYKI